METTADTAPNTVPHARDAFDAPLVAPDTPLPAVVVPPTKLATHGASAEEIAQEIATQYDLTTPDGWTLAMRSLASRPEVLRTLVRWLTSDPDVEGSAAKFLKALAYVTENGVGKPIERHEHTHRGVVRHEHVTPPVAWTDEDDAPPGRLTATASIDAAAAQPASEPPTQTP